MVNLCDFYELWMVWSTLLFLLFPPLLRTHHNGICSHSTLQTSTHWPKAHIHRHTYCKPMHIHSIIYICVSIRTMYVLFRNKFYLSIINGRANPKNKRVYFNCLVLALLLLLFLCLELDHLWAYIGPFIIIKSDQFWIDILLASLSLYRHRGGFGALLPWPSSSSSSLLLLSVLLGPGCLSIDSKLTRCLPACLPIRWNDNLFGSQLINRHDLYE